MKLLGLASALVLFAATAGTSSAAPAQRFAIPDVTFVALNPCTGSDTTITFTNQILVIHDDVDQALGQHVHGTITGDAANSDGFSGRFTNTFGMNLRDISDPVIEGEFLNMFSGTIRDSSGRVVRLHVLFHVAIPSGPSGTVTGSVDAFSLECLGRPV
jgi:hypothetical protein